MPTSTSGSPYANLERGRYHLRRPSAPTSLRPRSRPPVKSAGAARASEEKRLALLVVLLLVGMVVSFAMAYYLWTEGCVLVHFPRFSSHPHSVLACEPVSDSHLRHERSTSYSHLLGLSMVTKKRPLSPLVLGNYYIRMGTKRHVWFTIRDQTSTTSRPYQCHRRDTVQTQV
jgi:hypothetical protein